MKTELKDTELIEIKHVGHNHQRLSREPLEKIFADEWRELNSGIARGQGPLAYMLAENRNYPRDEVTDRDAMVAATVIQWLGSNVGQCFLSGVMEKYREKNDEQKKRFQNGQ